MATDVEVAGRLVLTLDDDRTIEVVAQGSRIRVDVGGLGSYLVPPRSLRSLRLLRSATVLVRRLAPLLHRRMLTLVVTRHGEPVLDLGTGVDGGPLGRLFGLSRVRLHRARRR